jgi:hypothetical protein
MQPHDATAATATKSLQCPGCGLPTATTDRFTLNGSPGPVEHLKLVCVAGHWYTPTIDSLREDR